MASAAISMTRALPNFAQYLLVWAGLQQAEGGRAERSRVARNGDASAHDGKPVVEGEGKHVLTLLERFFIYGVFGFFDEICFTAAHDIVNGVHDSRLYGYSSLWSFPIYAISSVILERMYLYLRARNVHWVLRGLIYTTWLFIWEFSCGYVLRMYGACSWDYSNTPYHVGGLIRLDYGPIWYSASLGLEYLFVYLLNLQRPHMKTVVYDDATHRRHHLHHKHH
eukprot:Opistho-1_new@90723